MQLLRWTSQKGHSLAGISAVRNLSFEAARLEGNPSSVSQSASAQTALFPKGTPPHLDSASTSKSDKRNLTSPVSPRRRNWSFTNRRPNISLDRPREWNRPLAPGVLPAYDHALKVIAKDSESLKSEAQELRSTIDSAAVSPHFDEGTLQKMRERLHILEVQSEINLPDVRWKFSNGMADLSRPVYRHLVEQRWRNDGALDLLMERIYQMNVVPDIIPAFDPSLDLRITFPTVSTSGLPQTVRSRIHVEPGIYLLPEQTIEPPKLYVSVFHTDIRLYTLLMVDPDVPHESEQTFQTFVHWMQPNIPLSSLQSQITDVNSHSRYIPPHPQKGTPYHRYVIFLLPQKSEILVPPLLPEQRTGFRVRDFVMENHLDIHAGAIHMWREVWSEVVSGVYSDILKQEEPKYGLPMHQDRHAVSQGRRRYVLQ